MPTYVGDSEDENKWAYTEGTFCSYAKRGERFEREAMAVAVDDGIGEATRILKQRGMWANTLMVCC